MVTISSNLVEYLSATWGIFGFSIIEANLFIFDGVVHNIEEFNTSIVNIILTLTLYHTGGTQVLAIFTFEVSQTPSIGFVPHKKYP